MGRNGGQDAHGQAGHHPKKLVQAAVEAVDGDAQPPPELRLAWECDRWHCLPEAGAYLDQDYALMTRMSALTNAYNAYSAYRSAQGAQIHNLSEGTRKILRYLKDIGVLFKA